MADMNNADLLENIPIPSKLPFLEDLCWQTDDIYKFTAYEMLELYERGWRYKDVFKSMTEAEKEFIKQLSLKYNSWLDTEL
jgi:hypothetical protein